MLRRYIRRYIRWLTAGQHPDSETRQKLRNLGINPNTRLCNLGAALDTLAQQLGANSCSQEDTKDADRNKHPVYPTTFADDWQADEPIDEDEEQEDEYEE